MFRQFSRFAIKVAGSRRAFLTLAGTGLSSIGTLLLSVLIARSESIRGMADFAIGMAAYLFVVGMSRAMVGEPISARLQGRSEMAEAGANAAFCGLAVGGLMTLSGILLSSWHLVIVGLASHGLSLFDHSKLLSILRGNPWLSVLSEAVRLVILIPLALMPNIFNSGLLMFASWVLVTVVIGYVTGVVQGIRMYPRLRIRAVPGRESISYGFDFILGSGTTQITTFLLGVSAVPAVNASLRIAGTLLGPVNVLATSMRALIIPFLSRGLKAESNTLPAANVAVGLMIIALPFGVLINFIPREWGEFLFGESWSVAAQVLPLLTLELVFSLISSVAFAGHRSIGAYRRTLVFRLILSPVKIVSVLIAAAAWSYFGAALVILINTVLGAFVWWISYVQLVRRVKNEQLALSGLRFG